MRPVAATGVTRYTKRAMVLGGCYLPAGTMVNVPFYAVHTLLVNVLPVGVLCILPGRSPVSQYMTLVWVQRGCVRCFTSRG